MATVDYTVFPAFTGDGLPQAHGAFIVEWNLADGDDGVPFFGPDYPDKSVQITKTGAPTVLIEGRNEKAGSTWSTLRDPQGNLLTFANTEDIKAIQPNVHIIRPRISAGTTVTAKISMLISTVARR